ncbi:hypothetical protein SDC9_167920 [bioreactor metagenome]|uniref:Uncharacterized protein n=1 Tax=bioreactor metagenome TaxID=1076179 RepID=A0A645G148_9ZZZZ
MHDIAAAHDQHAALAQLTQLAAHLEMLFGRQPIGHAQLHDGNAGLGEHGQQHRPGSVVKTPFLVHQQG